MSLQNQFGLAQIISAPVITRDVLCVLWQFLQCRLLWHFCELCRNAFIGTAADKPTRRMWAICEGACFQFVQLQFTNFLDLG